MEIGSKILNEAVEQLSTLPGIGKKSALRLALKLLNRNTTSLHDLSKSIADLADKINYCKICHNVSDFEVCEICSNEHRNKSLICVVEDIRDVLAIEATEQFYGVYHVLGGKISPMDGIGPKDLNIESLISRVDNLDSVEVLLALSANMEGDTTAFYISRKLSNFDVKLSTIARGISIGDEIEYADEITLGRSIINRIPYKTNA